MAGVVKRMGVTVLAVAALAVAGCSDGDDGDGSAAERAPATETTVGDGETGELTLEPETTTTTTPDDAALAELLLEEAPPGFAVADEGPLDLEAAAEAEADVEAERALLETRSFERGWSRRWASPSDDEVLYAAVYDFGAAQDALLYLEDGTQTLTARGATTFEVPDVADARGFTTVDETESGTFTASAVAFARGDKWFLVLIGSGGSGATPDVARQLAAAQAARVPA